jgi:adenylate cyclase
VLGPEKSERKLPAGAREHLTRILASPLFERSPRQSAFLRFVVEKVLAGEAAEIKEYEIAVNVYGRRADHSTRVDPIVRVEAARLRSKLLEYYASEGRLEEFRIELPKGAYVPEFVAAGVSEPAADPPVDIPHRTLWKTWWLAAIPLAAALGWLAFAYLNRATGSPLVPPNSKIPSSIAVMPIHYEPDQQAFGVQMTEALITELRQRNWPEWHIRSAVLNGDPLLPQQQADAVFTGSVNVKDGILRVTGSLEHSNSKIVLWNGTVEQKLADVPEADRGVMFEDLAYTISESINVALMERQEGEIAVVYPRRVEARHLWLEAEALWRRGDADSVRRAIDLLEKATALDPNFAWIRASLSFAYVRAIDLGFAPEATYRRRAHEQVARAQQLAPYLPFGNAAAVHVAVALDWNLTDASATCTRALNMLSASYSVRDQCAEMYSLGGHNDIAAPLEIRSIRRTRFKSIPMTELAWIRYRSRDFKEAQSLAEQALSIDKDYFPARRARVLAAMDRPEIALSLIRSGPPDPSGRMAALAATSLALQSKNADDDLSEAEQHLVRPDRTDLIRPYLALGLTARAKNLIDEAITQHNVTLLELAVDPQIAALDHTNLFDSVRSRAH